MSEKKNLPEQKIAIKPKEILGTVECCSLPNLHLPLIKAKIDTGAKTSALHAFDVEIFLKKKQKWVRFFVRPMKKMADIKVACEAPVIMQRNVRSSSGQIERRIVINTLLKLADTQQEIEITLSTKRDTLSYRMLLGRSAVRGFLIDPTKSYCQGRKPQKEFLLRYTKEK